MSSRANPENDFSSNLVDLFAYLRGIADAVAVVHGATQARAPLTCVSMTTAKCQTRRRITAIESRRGETIADHPASAGIAKPCTVPYGSLSPAFASIPTVSPRYSFATVQRPTMLYSTILPPPNEPRSARAHGARDASGIDSLWPSRNTNDEPASGVHLRAPALPAEWRVLEAVGGDD